MSDDAVAGGSALSLYHLLDPEVLANPYPLYKRLRDEDPVHWDPYLHAWVVTRYPDVVEVLLHFHADRTPTPRSSRSWASARSPRSRRSWSNRCCSSTRPNTGGFGGWPRWRSPNVGSPCCASTSARSRRI